MRTLYALLLLTLAATGAASAQTVAPAQTVPNDTLALTISPLFHYTTRTPSNGQPVTGCQIVFIGVHPDPAGRGRDSDYSYQTFLDSAPRNYRFSPYVGAQFSDPGDIPGERISFTMTSSSASTCSSSFVAGVLAFGSRLSGYAVYSRPEGPVALFDWEQTDGLTVRFDGTESHVATAQGRRPVSSYAWTTGDNRSASTTEHTFQQPGEYDVTLTVTDSNGNEDSQTRTVTVTGHQLTVKALPVEPGARYSLGDTLVVETTVVNTGSQTVRDITVPPFTEAIGARPDVPPGADTPQLPTMERIETRDPETRAALEVGERIVARDRFRVTGAASVRVASQTVAVDARAWGELPAAVQASSGSDAKVQIRRPCQGGACATWIVGPKRLDVALEFRTDGQTVTEAKVGLEFDPDVDPLLYQVLGIPFVSPFSFGGSVDPNTGIVSDLERHCHSACADIHFVLKDESTGEPIEGATVTLTASAIPTSAIVTPDHSGGHFCTPGLLSQTCSATVDTETDENGEIKAYYSFPGLIAAQDVEVTARTTHGGITGEATETLHIVPSPRTDFTSEVTLGRVDAALLSSAVLARAAGAATNTFGELCEGLAKGTLGGASDLLVRPGSTYILHGGADVLAEWACALNPFVFLSSETGGNAKKFAETTLVTWFGSRFLVPSGGIGILNGPFPPPFVLFFDGDYYGAVLDGLSQLPALVEGARMKLELYEVSWLQQETGLNGVPIVPGVYFKLSITPPGGAAVEHTALIEAGYDPVVWLSPPPSEILGEIAHAREERIRIRASQGQSRLSGVQALVADAEVLPGDYLFLGSGTPQEEFTEVRSVEGGSEVLLSRPLQFEHAADSRVLLVRGDSVASPPRAPAVIALDSTGTVAPLVLAWGVGRFETPASYMVQVARDAAFSDIVTTAVVALASGGRPAARYVYGDVTPGDVVYWRVRGENLIGDGPWSRTGRVEAVEGFGTAGEPGAPEDPPVLALGTPFPNPARGTATVAVDVPEAGAVRLSIYDALGREVAVAHEGALGAGRYPVTVDVGRLPAGVYVVRLVTDAGAVVRRMTVVR